VGLGSFIAGRTKQRAGLADNGDEKILPPSDALGTPLDFRQFRRLQTIGSRAIHLIEHIRRFLARHVLEPVPLLDFRFHCRLTARALERQKLRQEFARTVPCPDVAACREIGWVTPLMVSVWWTGVYTPNMRIR
jgi:hypothetical protein